MNKSGTFIVHFPSETGLDGSPAVLFHHLFQIGTVGKKYKTTMFLSISHLAIELGLNDDLLLRCSLL